GGAWNIWYRRFTGSPLVGDDPVRLTDHPADDRCPSVVRDGSGVLWVFWESRRRGRTTDIWFTPLTGSPRDAPRRIPLRTRRSHPPTAALDGAGNVRVFWSAQDDAGRSSILGTSWTGSDFAPVTQVSDAGPWRDESPAAVLVSPWLLVFFHSNRNGRSRIWAA